MERHIPEHLYEDYKRMIRDFAWYHHNRTGIDYTELVAQGNLIFCEAYKTFKKETATFSTHLHHTLTYRLTNYIKKNRKQNIKEGVCWTIWGREHPTAWYDECHQKIELEEMITELSNQARYIVNIILYYPDRLKPYAARQDGSKYETNIGKDLIKRYLINHNKWTKKQVNKCFVEITKAIKDLIK